MPAAQTRMSTRPNACEARVAQALQRGELADVGRMPQRPPPARFDRRRHLVHGVRAPAGGDDVGAGVGQAERERPADAGGAADDDRGSPGEIEESWHGGILLGPRLGEIAPLNRSDSLNRGERRTRRVSRG